MEASVTLKKVGKLVGDKTILAGLTFGVEKGSLVAIIGANDAGKSNLLKVLAGVENPEFGAVFVNGLDIVKRRSEIRPMVGYVPYEQDFDPWLTLEQNIKFIGSLYDLSETTIFSQMTKYSRLLELADFLPELAYDVSPGILKKAMLLRALIHDPDVLIIDEPTAFMDAPSNRLTWEILKSLCKNKTIIYASNSLLEVEQAHDRILVLQAGKIVLDGSLDRLLESTLDFHQFQIEFEELTEELYHKLSNIPAVVSPSRLNNIFHFYGRSRKVFFQVLAQASDAVMKDLNIKKLGLQDLMDSKLTGRGLD